MFECVYTLTHTVYTAVYTRVQNGPAAKILIFMVTKFSTSAYDLTTKF